jgi:hypothetical protein
MTSQLHAPRPRPRNLCGHCGRPVKHGTDFLRVCLAGSHAMILHWRCFRGLMIEHERRNNDGGERQPAEG